MMLQLLILSTVVFFVLSPAVAQQREIPGAAELLRTHGAVRLIARVQMPAVVPGLAPPASAAELATASVRPDDVLQARAISPNLVTVTVRERGVADLAQNQNVTDVFVDTLSEPFLIESLQVIGAPKLWGQRIEGAGFAIVIADTGIDRTHPFFANKIVQEACFSSTAPEFGSTTLCPNRQDEQKGPGAAAACSLETSGCDHGTHVAGIAVGAVQPLGSQRISGAAPGAQLIAIQVFSLIRNRAVCGSESPCIRSWTSDQIEALNHVRELARERPIAAVNFSLGGGRRTAACDDHALKRDIDDLLALGIVTIIAAGNSGHADAIGEPACISSAVSVTASDDMDQLATRFTNRARFVSLVAPGDDIRSAIPGNGYGIKAGTSMAAPHVAGAWALLRSARPQAQPQEILQAFIMTAPPIRDPATGATYRRIDVAAALASEAGMAAAPPMPTEAQPSEPPTPTVEGIERAIVTPTSPTAGISDIFKEIRPEIHEGKSVTVDPLPDNRYTITAPKQVIDKLREQGTYSIQTDVLSAPK